MRTLKYTILGIGVLMMASCNDFLDTIPDDRTEIDSEDKVGKLLVSAYPQNSPVLVAELSSDNLDDYGANNPYYDRFHEQIATWQTITESDNESTASIWASHYSSIASANYALQAIEKMGSPESLNAYKGEALLCRAYAHFILVNLFCQHYGENSIIDMGIPYVETVESSLAPVQSRGTVFEVYQKMVRDVEEGLPLIDDTYLPTGGAKTYHFNKRAAYAFASRMYLYMGEWEKVVECADVVLGKDPASMLHPWKQISEQTYDWTVFSRDYYNETYASNLLVSTSYSQLGLVFGPYSHECRFSHGLRISMQETMTAPGPWGKEVKYWQGAANYSANNLYKMLVPKMPYLFEYSDKVNQIGFRHTVTVNFSADEVLLNRAEANIMLDNYTDALTDMNLWMANMFEKDYTRLSISNINTFFNATPYYDISDPENAVVTVKRQLNPPGYAFTPGQQENFIQTVLWLRRVQTIHEGLRWYDTKRWGIEINKVTPGGNGMRDVKSYISLPPGDFRRAIQIPEDVIAAGMTRNPR